MVTGEMVEELVLSGADIIKVGIGPGRIITGGVCVVGWRGRCHRLLVQGLCAQRARRLVWGIPS